MTDYSNTMTLVQCLHACAFSQKSHVRDTSQTTTVVSYTFTLASRLLYFLSIRPSKSIAEGARRQRAR